MNKYKICPDCLTEHKPIVKRCGCGYAWPEKTESAYFDKMHGCCEFNINGTRCHYPGTFTHSLNGSGPWLCSNHSKNMDNIEMCEQIVKESHKSIPRPDYSFQARRSCVTAKVRSS